MKNNDFSKQYEIRNESILLKQIKIDEHFKKNSAGKNGVCKYTLPANISSILNNASGIVSWKNHHFEFMGCTEPLAQLANLKSPKLIIGKQDEELPWGKGYINIFKEQDKKILAGHITWILGRYAFADKKRIILTKKVPLLNSSQHIVGIINYISKIHHQSLHNITQTLLHANITITPELLQLIQSLFNVNQNNIALSPREEESLYYLMQGMTAKEVGKQLGLSYRTIEYYITSIKDKFRCTKLSGVIVKAMEQGYMDNILTRQLLSRSNITTAQAA